VTLGPSESRSLVFATGAGTSAAECARLLKTYSTTVSADAALDTVKKKWKDLLRSFSAVTPDPAMNTALSPWLQYQAISGRLLGRTAYYQVGGAYGFRDQLQDSQIFLPLDPKRTARADQTPRPASIQRRHGLPLVASLSETGHPTDMTDDLLWLRLSRRAVHGGDRRYFASVCREPFVDDRSPRLCMSIVCAPLNG